MLPARRWFTTARPFLVFLFFLAAGSAIASCRDDPTGPGFDDVTPRGQPRAESWSAGQGSLGTVSIPVPSVNDPNNGEVSWISTGMSIPDSTYVKVSLDGTISLSTHPDYFSITGNQAPYNGTTVGPWGISSSQLRVRVEMLDTAGATRFVYSGYPGTGADSALSTVRKLNTGGSFRVMRKGVSGGASCGQPNWDPETDPPCWNGAYYWVAPGYNLSGAQNLQVETFDPFEFNDASGEIVEGATVTASAAPHAYVDSLGRERWWYREGDTLATPLGRGGVYLGTCANQSECSYEPQEGGRFYFQARVYAGGTDYQEDVSGDPVLLRDYVFDEEPDTVLQLGDVTGGGGSLTYKNVWLSLSCDSAHVRGSFGGCRLGTSSVGDSFPAPTGVTWSFAANDTAQVPDTVRVTTDSLWLGTVVTSGRVSASFTVDTVSPTLTADLLVARRDWWTEDLQYPVEAPDSTAWEKHWRLTQAIVLGDSLFGSGGLAHVAALDTYSVALGITNPGYDTVNEDWGFELLKADTFLVALVDSGPNQDILFVETQPHIWGQAGYSINPRLKSTDSFRFRGMLTCDSMTIYEANTTCAGSTVALMDSLLTGIRWHESIGDPNGCCSLDPFGGGDSHWRHYRLAIAYEYPASKMERMVGAVTKYGDSTAGVSPEEGFVNWLRYKLREASDAAVGLAQSWDHPRGNFDPIDLWLPANDSSWQKKTVVEAGN